MASVTEQWESPEGTNQGDDPQIRQTYIISDYEEMGDAEDALNAYLIATYKGVGDDYPVYRNLVPTRVWVERKNDDTWLGTVTWGALAISAIGSAGQFSFDTTGGTQHITHSLQTVHNYAASGTAPNFQGAIGVTKDSVDGCDITVPVYKFTETHRIATAFITGAYKATVFRLSGAVNSDAFRGFSAGEVLFLGATGGPQTQNFWEITYHFAASPNVSGLKIGAITGIEKRGWDYLWVRYEDAVDDDAKILIKKPLSVHVERVYEYLPFSSLGI